MAGHFSGILKPRERKPSTWQDRLRNAKSEWEKHCEKYPDRPMEPAEAERLDALVASGEVDPLNAAWVRGEVDDDAFEEDFY